MTAAIYLDIETLPSRDESIRDEIRARLKPPGTLKKSESIAEWWEVTAPGVVEEEWLKTALDGTYGRLACIGYAVDDEPVVVTAGDDSTDAEAHLLRLFFDGMRAVSSGNSGQRPVLVGHNHVGFDLPFLWRRAVILGVRPPLWWPTPAVKPWSDQIFDTMLQWAGQRGTISLDRLAKALGIAGKAGMSGADVWPAWQRGERQQIADYCADDVRITREIHRRMTFQSNT